MADFPQEQEDLLRLLLGLRPELLMELLLRRRASQFPSQEAPTGPPPPPPLPPNLNLGPVPGSELPTVSILDLIPLVLRRKARSPRNVSSKIARPPGGGL